MKGADLVILTAGLAAVGVGAWYVVSKLRVANAQDRIAQAGADLTAIRGSSPGAYGAAVADFATQTNTGTRTQTEDVYKSSRATMLAWRSGGNGVPADLSVVLPKDKSSQWRIGESAWFPGQPGTQNWRQSPVGQARGIDLNGVALVYWPDVYGATKAGADIVATSKRPLSKALKLAVGQPVTVEYADPTADVYELFAVATSDAGGRVAVWDNAGKRWLKKGDFFLAPSAIVNPLDNPKQARYLAETSKALRAKRVFQPWTK